MRMAGGDSLSFLPPQAPAFGCRLKGLPVAVLQASVYNQTIITSTYFCSVSTELVQHPNEEGGKEKSKEAERKWSNSFLLPERQGSVKRHHQNPRKCWWGAAASLRF